MPGTRCLSSQTEPHLWLYINVHATIPALPQEADAELAASRKAKEAERLKLEQEAANQVITHFAEPSGNGASPGQHQTSHPARLVNVVAAKLLVGLCSMCVRPRRSVMVALLRACGCPCPLLCCASICWWVLLSLCAALAAACVTKAPC